MIPQTGDAAPDLSNDDEDAFCPGKTPRPRSPLCSGAFPSPAHTSAYCSEVLRANHPERPTAGYPIWAKQLGKSWTTIWRAARLLSMRVCWPTFAVHFLRADQSRPQFDTCRGW
jgi:hypothetical protein